jgi:hypothetical protein
MTMQIPDEVQYKQISYAITAVDGTGLFDPAEQGVTPGPLSTGCWRGFHCAYRIHNDLLKLETVVMGMPDGQAVGVLFGSKPVRAGRKSIHRGALLYQRLSAPIPFTGRLLLGADPVHIGYLNMGFLPAWLFSHVCEVVFASGRVAAIHDRSDALADVRQRLGNDGLRPADHESTQRWVRKTFSLTFDYSWPAR